MRLTAIVRRHPRATALTVLVTLALAVFGLSWFQPHKLFIDDRVDEGLPVADVEAAGDPTRESPEGGDGDGVAAGLEEESEPAEPTVLAAGRVRPLDHGPASGRAMVVRLLDGRTFLRLEDLTVDNGPDLRVYLSSTSADGGPVDEEAFLDDFVDLGDLKGNLGSSNYRIPDRVDLDRYTTAVIWCRRFTVGFAVAALT